MENLEAQLLSELKDSLEYRYRYVQDPFRECADDVISLCRIRLEDITRRENKQYPTEADYLQLRRGTRLASDILGGLAQDYPQELAGYVISELPTNKVQWLFRVVQDVLLNLTYGVAGYEADREEDEPGFIEKCNEERAEYAEPTRD